MKGESFFIEPGMRRCGLQKRNMVQRRRVGGWLGMALATLVGTAAAQVTAPAVPRMPRVDGDWRSTLQVVAGTEAPSLPMRGVLAGSAPASARLERVLLLLEPAPQQRQALDIELARQQDPKSPEFHHWLTASQFADAYGNSAADVAGVVSWL